MAAESISIGGAPAPAAAAPSTEAGGVLPGTKVLENGQVTIDRNAAATETAKTDEAAKAAEAEKAKKDERPSWLPEKFKTVEDFAKSYEELEKKLGSGKKEEPAAEAKTKEGKEAAKAVKDAGFDFQALEAEFAENSGLTDETYASLEAKGLNRELVDRYIDGRKAIGAQMVSTLTTIAGSEDAVRDTLEWAKDNLDASEIAAYNKAINASDPVTTKILFHSIHAKYAESGGVEPQKTVDGGVRNGAASAQAFESRAQMVAEMKNPKYQKDAAYRAQVERRLAATDFSKLR